MLFEEKTAYEIEYGLVGSGVGQNPHRSRRQSRPRGRCQNDDEWTGQVEKKTG